MSALFTVQQYRQLLCNGQPESRSKDHYPVVKLHMPNVAATWLLSWLDPDDTDTAFGLCDTGICPPRLRHVSLSDIISLNESLGFAVERDTGFVARHPLSVYAKAADKAGRFTEAGLALTGALRRKAIPLRRMHLRP